ncbi:hypothetical protein ADUPG1_010097, partial [Aduncisulcus paluster]
MGLFDSLRKTNGLPIFVHEGSISCIPIPRDDPTILNLYFEKIKSIFDIKSTFEDTSLIARKMMKGECSSGQSTQIWIPFTSSVSVKGVYICLSGYKDPPSHLIITSFSSATTNIVEVYEFPSFKGVHWYYLPIDLSDIVLCRIEGEGRDKKYFNILSLAFFREETSEEYLSRKFREKIWYKTPIVESKFVKEGDYESKGRDSIPIPRDDPEIIIPSFSNVKGNDNSYCKESEFYDKTFQAQNMLQGKDYASMSHISIPFISPSSIKGAYICIDKNASSPSLQFIFSHFNDASKTYKPGYDVKMTKRTWKRYEFTRPKSRYEWHFLPIDLDNVVLCEIEGKGTWIEKKSRSFSICSLVFIRGEAKGTKLPSKLLKCAGFSSDNPKDSLSKSTSSRQQNPTTRTTLPVLINKGGYDCIPIPRDAPIIVEPQFSNIQSRNETQSIKSAEYDQSFNAKKMMKGEGNSGFSTHICIPFSSSSSMKGAYMCLSSYETPPSYLSLIFTTSKRSRITKKYEFPHFEGMHWYFLPVDLSDIIKCEIEGKGGKKEYFNILSLVFCREESSEESMARKIKEQLWVKSPIVKSEFIKEGDKGAIPIPRDDPKVVKLSLSMV